MPVVCALIRTASLIVPIRMIGLICHRLSRVILVILGLSSIDQIIEDFDGLFGVECQ